LSTSAKSHAHPNAASHTLPVKKKTFMAQPNNFLIKYKQYKPNKTYIEFGEYFRMYLIHLPNSQRKNKKSGTIS